MPTTRWGELLARLPVTGALTLLVCAVFAVEVAVGAPHSLPTLIRMGAMHAGRVVDHGEAWRLLTAAFLHGGWVHFALNTFALVQLAALVELLFGSARLAGFYFVCALAGNLASAAFNPRYLAIGQVGASGALYGLVGVLLGVALYGAPHWREQLRRPRRALLFAVGFGVALLVAQVFLGAPILVDHWAHAGGFVTGLLLAAAYPEPMVPVRGVEHVLAWVAVAVTVGSFAAAWAWGGRALETLPEEAVVAFGERLDRAEDGWNKALLAASAAELYEEVGVEDPVGTLMAQLDDASPTTLVLLQTLVYDTGRDDLLLAVQERWLALEPDDPDALNGVAWTLVTHRDPARRDPARAVALATRALERLEEMDAPERPESWLVRWRFGDAAARRRAARAAYLDTRAEALYQLGRYAEAARDQREAVALAEEVELDTLDEMRDRLARIERALAS